MSDKPRDLTLERVNRLTLAIADLTESHAAQGRQFLGMMQRLSWSTWSASSGGST